MTRINKEALKTKKESQRAIQYPRIMEPTPESIPVPEPKKKVAKKRKK